MSNKNVSFKMMVLAVLVVFTLLIAPMSAFADGGATVSLKQTNTDNGLMEVDVMIEDVTDLYGLEFEIAYDPSVVAIKDAATDQDGVQIQMGDFLPTESGFVVANQVADGKIVLAATLLNPAPPVSGDGVLAHFTLEPLNNQASELTFSQLNLVSGEMQPIPVQTNNLSFGSESASGGSMMWIFIGGGLLLVVAIAGIGGFVAMSGGKEKKATPRKRSTAQSKLSA